MSILRRRSERGAAAVEFALVAPILLGIVLAIVDFGLAINRYAMINNAAREGVREASLGATQAEILAVVSRRTGGLSGSTGGSVTCTKPDGSACTSWDVDKTTGGIAEVTVTSTSTWLTPVGRLVSERLEIARTTKMRIE